MILSAKQKFWQQHIQSWRCGSLSQATYCSKHHLSLASFGYWRKRIKSDLPPTMIPVVREAPLAGVQLRSLGGLQIALPATISLEALRGLMASLP